MRSMTMPTALAELRAHLQKKLDDCCRLVDDLSAEHRIACANRDVAYAELRGIDAAVEAYADKEPPPTTAKRRRNIKELAAVEIAQTPGWSGMSRDERIRYLCKQLRCKPSQAEAAMRVNDGRAE